MVFSCEFLGHYKPDIKSYQKASELLGLHPEQVMMCAAHENDLDAAIIYLNERMENIADEIHPYFLDQYSNSLNT